MSDTNPSTAPTTPAPPPSEERWNRLQAMFHAALELPASERSGWLRAQAGEDEELLAEAMELVAIHDDHEDLVIEPSTPDPVPRPAPDTSLPAERIGPYRLERHISSGGMGRVFQALQEHPRRRVALKLLNRALASPTAVRRFEYESQVLANLQHPAIAHVYDSGTVEVGGQSVPWYAMELVEGERTFRDLIRSARPSLERRVTVFLEACDGVAHAHQKGVIHRDLKPGNVLLDGAGRVKLIDFGIAKPLERDAGPMLTSQGQLMGTLEYMSPEQTQGDPRLVDTRTDVYALGVMLYELCARKRPYELDRRSLKKSTETICSTAPALEPLLAAKVPTDLRLIILKALSKEPDQRYATAAELAADLRRYLRNEPIEARPPSVLYQMRRFAARNRVLVVSAAALVVALGLGAAGSTHGLIQAREAQAQAQTERDRAEQARAGAEQARKDAEWARDFANGILLSADPWETQGRDTTVREVLDAAARRLDEETNLRPGTELQARETLTEVYAHLAKYDLAEHHARRGLEVAGMGAEHQDVRLRLMLGLAETLSTMDRAEEAAAMATEALELHRKRYGEQDRRTWNALATMANVVAARGDFEAALALRQEVYENRRTHQGEDHADTIDALESLGNDSLTAGRVNEASEILRKVWDIRKQRQGEGHPATLATARSVIHATMEGGNLEAAEALFPRVLPLMRDSLGVGHDTTMGTVGLHAIVLRRLGRAEESLALSREVLAVTSEKYGPDHMNTLRTRNNVGLALMDAEQYGEAERTYRELIDTWRKRDADGDGSYLVVAINFARLMIRQDRGKEALPVLEEFIARAGRDYPADYWLTELARNRLGEIRDGKGDEVKSERGQALIRTSSPGD